MKNDKRANLYISLICNHLSKLGYSPELKGTVSRYIKIGNTRIRVSDHFGYENETQLNIIVSRYTKDIIIVSNNNPTVLHTIKEVKDFLNNFIFYKETCGQLNDVCTKRVGSINKEYTEYKQKAESSEKLLRQQIAEEQVKVKDMETKWLNAVKQVSDLKQNNSKNIKIEKLSQPVETRGDIVSFDLSTITEKGRKSVNNCLSQAKSAMKRYRK